MKIPFTVSQHKFNPFPEAIEKDGVELQEVTVKEVSIRSKAAGKDTVVVDPSASSATDLATAVDSLTALLRWKALMVPTASQSNSTTKTPPIITHCIITHHSFIDYTFDKLLNRMICFVESVRVRNRGMMCCLD